MGGRHSLVIASQCDSLNLLSFLPGAAREVSGALLDPEVGGCVPAVGDGLLIDPTMVELDDAIAEAFERASEDEATLFLALVGHGEYSYDDFYFLTKDSEIPADGRRAFLLAQRIKELLGRHSMLDGLVILLDTCHAGIAAEQAAHRWIRIVGDAGKRFEVLTASDDRTAADGCFSRSLTRVLRAGRPELGERLRCPDLKRVISGYCPAQTAVHLAFDGVRTVEKGDQGLWLAVNAATEWQLLRGNPAASEIERLTDGYRPPPELGHVVGHLLTGARCVVVTGPGHAGLLAALARPAVAEALVPPRFLHAVLFPAPGQTNEQVAGELARQLGRTVPGFEQAADQYRATVSADAFDRLVLGPLLLLAPQSTETVRIGVSSADEQGWFRRLTTDPRLDWVKLVLATQSEVDVPGAVTVSPGFSLSPADEIDWMMQEQVRGISAPPSPVLELLEAAHGLAPVPIGILVQACRLWGGPSGISAVRDALARVGDEVIRSRPGTPDEHVRSAFAVRPSDPALLHLALAEAIAEVAPVSERDRGGPEQAYADASEAEHLWRSGRHEDAVAGLEVRESVIPVENRERWGAWARRVAGELGATDPLTLRSQARLATWTGKAGDAAGALAMFRELLPLARQHLGEGNRETLSVRNNIGFLLGELGRHEESRDEFRSLVADATASLGPDDEETLHARHLLAVATGKCGEGGKSLRLSRELLPDAERALGSDHEIVGHIRHNIVFWGTEIAHPPPDLDEHRRLLTDERRRLNNDKHPDLLALRLTVALALAKSGQVGEALAAWETQLPDAIEVLGERHPLTGRIREQLEHWRR